MATEIDLEQALDWLADDEGVLSLAGAGLSIPAPACAPSVPTVLTRSMEILSAAAGLDATFDDTFLGRLLPESAYGAIAAATGGADHLRLWQSYAWAADRSGERAPQPNAGHHLLVALAECHRLPVLTTNFDCFLEKAAERQQLAPQVGLPTRGGRFHGTWSGPGQVSIWKLHGTALDASTLRSQPADLVRSSYDALRADLSHRVRRLLVVGYSGRDFDVFPWLSALARHWSVLWVDLRFDADHRAHSLANCLLWKGSFEDLARRFFATRASGVGPGVPAIADRSVRVPPAVSDTVRREFTERVRHAVEREIGAAVGHRPRAARLAVVVTLNTVADFPQAMKVGEQAVNDPRAEVHTLLALQFAQASTDRFRSAEATARLARRRALRTGDPYGWGRAELARADSRFKRFTSSFNDPLVRRPRGGNAVRLASAVRLLCDAVLLAPLHLRAVAVTGRGRENARHYDALSFSGDYIEHLIRLLAITMAVTARLPGGRLFSGLHRVLLSAVERGARRAGYMRGMLNVAKYRARLTGRDDRAQDALLGAEVVGDLVAGAIAARDAALLALGVAQGLPAGDPAALSARAGAERLLAESIAKARLCGNPTLVLKNLLIARRHGLPVGLSADEVTALVDALEGEVDQSLGPAVRALLT